MNKMVKNNAEKQPIQTASTIQTLLHPNPKKPIITLAVAVSLPAF